MKKGAFELNFYVRGEQKQVVIDDKLATDDDGNIINAKPSMDGQSWYLPLIEKAYAKMNVNYKNLNKGNNADNLLALR